MDARYLGRSALVALLFSFVVAPVSPAQSVSLRASTSPSAEQKPTKSTLREALLARGYVAIPMKRTDPGHYVIEATIREKKVLLIVDTGAPTLCLDTSVVDERHRPEGEEIPDKGATRERGWQTTTGGLRIGEIRCPDLTTTVFDFTEVNASLKRRGVPSIDGLFGDAELRYFSAVIDLPSETLFLIDPTKREWSKLEGRWQCVRVEREGIVLDRERARTVAMIFRDGKVVRFEAGEKLDTQDVAVNVAVEPNEIDFVTPGRDGKPASVIQGVYRIAGDRLSWCSVSGKKEGVLRPTGFEAKSNSGHVSLEFEPMDPRTELPDAVRGVLGNSGYQSIELSRESRFVMVPCHLQDKSLSLVLDTGTVHACLHEQKATEFELGSGMVSTTSTLIGKIPTSIHQTNAYRIGKCAVLNMDLTVSNLSPYFRGGIPFDGLLGTNTLERLSAVIDYSTNKLYILDPTGSKK
jgi:uncharacterized protein (TIGR03067 family)